MPTSSSAKPAKAAAAASSARRGLQASSSSSKRSYWPQQVMRAPAHVNRIKLISAPSAPASTAANLQQAASPTDPPQRPATPALKSLLQVRQHPTGYGEPEVVRKPKGSLRNLKLLLLTLASLDLLLSLLVHRLASEDQLSLWLAGPRVRLSLVNVVLSGVWLVAFAAALLYELKPLLLTSLLLHLTSFALLLGLSSLHLTRRLDYHSIHLSQLLAQLFLLSLLHLYLLGSALLTLQLLLAVRRRAPSLKTSPLLVS